MCRSIKQLRRQDGEVTAAEIQAAALQYIRKVSGFRKPSRSNGDAFDAAVAEVTAVTRRLLDEINAHAPAARSKSPASARDVLETGR